MAKLVLRWLINATALWAAAWLVPGVRLSGGFFNILGVALVFGLVNALIRPIAKLLSFPLILLSLGLFTWVINAAMLGLTAALTDNLSVSGLWAALWGSLVISLVSWLLSTQLPEESKKEPRVRSS